MTNYRAAKALMRKGYNAGEGPAMLSRNGLRKQTAGLSRAAQRRGTKKSAVKNHAAMR